MQQVVRWFAVCLAFWLISSARAQGPSGELQFSFSRTNMPVWDFSGEYNITNTIEERLSVVHNAGGRITGTGDAIYDDGSVRVRLTGRFNGRVSGTRASRIQLNASGSGRFSGTSSGRPIKGPATFGLVFGLDPQNATLAGTQSARVCVFVRCQTLAAETSLPLPSGMDAHWSLALNAGTTNNNIRGSALATLANGKALPYKVRGKYSPKTNISTLTLQGTSIAAGSVLTLKLDSANNLVALTGRLFGQRLVFP